MSRLFFCGEALIDFVPVTGPGGAAAYEPKPGGSPYNAAKAAARAGGASHFVGAISTDFFGDMLAAHLGEHGVDTALAPRSDLPTTLAFVDLSGGDPRYAFFNTGSAVANMAPDPRSIEPRPGDILDVGSISLIDLPGAEGIAGFALALAPRLMLAIDPNARPGMVRDMAGWRARIDRLCDAAAIVRVSDEDIAAIAPGQSARDFAEARLARGAALVVVTHGPGGAEAFTRQVHVSALSPPAEVVDTVGAGDTLMGAMLARISEQGLKDRAALAALTRDDLGSLLAHACAAAALNCERRGCAPPTSGEIEALLAR